MKKLIPIVLLAAFFMACGGKTETNQKINASQQTNLTDASLVNVYYFHGKQRCKTCIAIEEVTKKTVADNYKDNPKVRFVEVNIEEDKNKDLAEKYEIAFSSLVVAKGENSTDLTEQAFANAVGSPEMLTQLIKEEVDKRID